MHYRLWIINQDGIHCSLSLDHLPGCATSGEAGGQARSCGGTLSANQRRPKLLAVGLGTLFSFRGIGRHVQVEHASIALDGPTSNPDGSVPLEAAAYRLDGASMAFLDNRRYLLLLWRNEVPNSLRLDRTVQFTKR